MFDIQVDGIGEEWNVFWVSGWWEWRENFETKGKKATEKKMR